MPGMTGLEILKTIKKEKPSLYVIIMTAQDTMKNAIEAMKMGAYDYIAKPFELEEMEMIVEKAMEARRLSEEVKYLREGMGRPIDQEAKIVGSSKAVREIYKTIGKVASSDVSVLVTGESGTGKELVARAIHQNSARANGPFLAVNCAAIPKDLLESELFGYRKGAFTGADENRAGFFEMANKGTLFLDEIGDLPLNLQGKLLRILQEKEVQRLGSSESKPIDVRILAATNQDLQKMVKEKKFREDLFFRLNVIPFHLPPLRDRMEDIPLLCEYFLRGMAQDMETTPKNISLEALETLKHYHWPGNIRELENVVKRAAVLSANENLSSQDFAFFLGKSEEAAQEALEELGLEELIESRLKSFLSQLSDVEMTDLYSTILPMTERPLLKLVLKKTGNNQIRAAKLLGINRNTLRKKIRELGIRLKEEA
jgi:two-component system nitrogen regulation response regulator GlnG